MKKIRCTTKELLEVAEKIGWSIEPRGPLEYRFFTSQRESLVHEDDLQDFLCVHHPKDLDGWEYLFNEYREEPPRFFTIITGRPTEYLKGMTDGLQIQMKNFPVDSKVKFQRFVGDKRRGLMKSLYLDRRMSVDQIATELSISKGSVIYQLHKANVKMRRRGAPLKTKVKEPVND